MEGVGKEYNGSAQECPGFFEIKKHREDAKVTMDQIKELYIFMPRILEHTSSLVHLKALSEAMLETRNILKEMKDNLFNAALGRDQIPTALAADLLNRDERRTKRVFWALCGVITILISLLGFVVTGKHYGWLPFIGN